jgi:hypothetical protein
MLNNKDIQDELNAWANKPEVCLFLEFVIKYLYSLICAFLGKY